MAPLILILAALVPTASGSFAKGSKALAEFRPEKAVKLLKKATKEGPYGYQDYVRLHEELGIAYAYVEDQAAAKREFSLVLMLDPGHAISYTLSPKVTFLFEQARQQANERQPPVIDLV